MDATFDKKLSNFVINLSCPCLILSSVMGDTLPDKHLILPILEVGFITYILFTIVAIFLPRIITSKVENRGLYGFMLAFGNVGFIGYPVTASIFGDNAVFYASLLNFPNTVFIFTLGSMLVSGDKDSIHLHWRTFFCPGLMASYLSMLIVFLGWDNVPSIISTPMQLLGNITVPAALLIIGSSMAQMPLKDMLGNRSIYMTAALRLLILPALFWAFFVFCGFDRTVVNINTVLAAMPVATYGTMFCIKYGHGEALMTEGTFVTTALSIFTIPIIALLF